MESNEVLVLYNFYSRVAKTTGIVKMSRKPYSDFTRKMVPIMGRASS